MTIYSYWQRVGAANMSLANSAVRIAEVMMATLTVVRVRGDLIGAGLTSPIDADWREMHKMVSEKISAFGKSGAAANKELGLVQSKMLADWQQALMLPFSSADPDAAAKAGTRFAALGLDMLELTARLTEAAIKPVHQTVTANAKRLG